MYLSDLEGIVAETEKEGEVQWSSDVKTAEIEFWRNIGLGDSSTVYTAQSVNSTLFDKSTRPWNLHAMRQQRQEQKAQKGGAGARGSGKQSAQGILGVGLGMAGTARGWSMPDQECFVIQYIHRGAPRTVYSVSPASRQRFEALVATLRAEVSEGHAQGGHDEEYAMRSFRASCLLIDPAVFSKHKVEVYRTTLSRGEFLVHWPASYHCSFSHGVSCFEAAEWMPTQTS